MSWNPCIKLTPQCQVIVVTCPSLGCPDFHGSLTDRPGVRRWEVVWQGSSPLGGRMAREYAAGRETPHVFSSHLQTPQGKFATGNPFAGGRRGGVLGWHWCIDAQVFVRTPVVFISLWFDLGRESGCGRNKRWCSLSETNISSPGSKYLKYLFVHKQFVCKQYFLTRVQRRELSGASQINNLDWR